MIHVRTSVACPAADLLDPSATGGRRDRSQVPRTITWPRAVALALACAGELLALGVAAPSAARAQASPYDAECAALRGARRLTYRNPRYGFVMTYPSAFALDPGSVPEGGDSARFWTADRRATAVVTGLRNGMGQSLPDLLREARQDVTENGRGTITYERARAGWFVISGYVADRIYYRRTFLSHAGQVIGALWIEFPRHLRPCFEEAVTMMSLSFRPGEP